MVDITRMEHTGSGWEVTWKFDDESFETLRTIAEAHHFKVGATVFREGDPADGMYLVVKGSALIVRKTATGEERTVGIINQDQSFGEIGLLVDRPRQATVSAGTDLDVLKITKYGLEVLHRNAPDMAFMMYQVLARSLAEQLLHTQEMQRPE